MEANANSPKKKLSTGKKVLIGVGILIVLIAITRPKKASTEDETTEKGANIEMSKPVGIKEVLKTPYFEVTINKQYVTFNIETGNEFADKKADEGNMFLVLNTSFRNTDTESRMMTDGTLLVNTNDGKEYKFEQSETIMLDGWGLMLKNINPLNTVTTNVVYQIPEKLKGKVYYQPSRSEDKIFLGDFDLTNLE